MTSKLIPNRDPHAVNRTEHTCTECNLGASNRAASERILLAATLMTKTRSRFVKFHEMILKSRKREVVGDRTVDGELGTDLFYSDRLVHVDLHRRRVLFRHDSSGRISEK